MPLTALHATAGALDLTAPDVGAIPWEQFHRTRPRAPLTCRECGHGLHAKVSRLGTRFFAHDAGAPECSLTGETMAHRMLKMELATAIRSAGWHAELEVPGTGWRADVLATSPDGQTRMAWEAQLASTTAQDLTKRTATMAAEGVDVCWVSDKNTPWMGQVPSIQVRSPGGSEHATNSGLAVIAGPAVFDPLWCERLHRCHRVNTPYGRPPGPCAGHGHWTALGHPMDLHRFVQHVLRGAVKAVRSSTALHLGFDRYNAGPYVWTTHPHWAAEQKQLQAQAARDAWVADRGPHWDAIPSQRALHEAAKAALLARQAVLRPLAVEFVAQQAGGPVGVRDPDPDWAMGTPLYVDDLAQAVISPVASRINDQIKQRLAAVTVIVASTKERNRLAKACADEQRFEQFEVETAESMKPSTAISVQKASGRLFLRH
ncbi:competence protein CoiA family protein [Terrabacter tumescens]|uniref:competence protein CoiA family protein n=1 Tax=Terrabacter tumescens TaxID=60443 RepID=UPI00138E298C|nr:competence protein CoiA family protein [Terrabacter tumescens]